MSKPSGKSTAAPAALTLQEAAAALQEALTARTSAASDGAEIAKALAAAINAGEQAKIGATPADTLGDGNVLLPSASLTTVMTAMLASMQSLTDLTHNISLTTQQRYSLQGADSKRFGLMSKVYEVAQENKDFLPTYLHLSYYNNVIEQIDALRNILIATRQIERVVGDVLLVTTDEGYRLALMYYNSVRDAARRRVTGAQAIFEMLRAFFSRRSPRTGEPTETQTLRDVKAILHGKKDGRIVIEGEAPHLTKGKRRVVDEVHQSHGAFRETVTGTICEHCSTEIPAHAKFCLNCGKDVRINN
jgi:hypothetical protein